MPNKQKGELKFVAGGRHYTLRFSTNALCVLEDATGVGALAVAAQLNDPEKMEFRVLRSMFRAGLSDSHPDMDDTEAGEIMTALGFDKVMPLIGEAFELMFPDDSEAGAASDKGKQKAA
ncbi:MAG TPA: hypothetical protein DCG72_03700 [Gammaproteobacteria bacterium]|nr:hypothetical protein [Gammaproteobacteria bacterium]